MLELMAITAHKLWIRRNSVIFGGKVLSPSCLLKCAKDTLFEFQEACSSPLTNLGVVSALPTNLGAGTSVRYHWTNPSEGWIKLNWDAAIDSNSNTMGLGLVARDFTGKVRAMMCNFLPYVTDPAVAEAFAARQGAILARDMGFQKVVLEGDSQVIVQALNSESVCAVAYASLVADTRTLLQTFPAWCVDFIRREGNVVAHHLARLAVSNRVFQVWVESFPDSVCDLVCLDQGDLSSA